MKQHAALTIVTGFLFAALVAVCVAAFSAHAQVSPYPYNYSFSQYLPYVSYPSSLVATGSCAFYRDLTIGSSGADVTSLQTFLEGRGFLVMPYGVAKGYFGALTQAALARYQASVGMYPATGYFDYATRARVSADYSSYNSYQYQYPSTYSYYPYSYTGASIRVTQPNSGEVYHPGDTVNIRWDASGLVNRPFTVCLSNSYEECYRTIANIPADSFDRRNYTTQWYVGDNLPTGDYRIVISSVDNYGIRVVDQSDNWFRITSTRDSLRIVPDTLADASVNTYYNQTIRVDRNNYNYNNCNYNYNYSYCDNYYDNTNLQWHIVSGSLPPGLNFQQNYQDARIFGNAYTTGTYSFTVEVTDRYRTNSQSYSITVR